MLVKAFNSKMRPLVEPTVVNLYQQSKKESFYLKTEIVKAKKGERRFYVAAFENASGKTKCVVGKYLNEPITVAIN